LFRSVLKAVDVFHFKNAHAKTDEFCQQQANPYKHDIMFDSEGKWRFNSSAAEMVNSWICRFYSVCLNMKRVNYDFTLDVVIKYRNLWHVETLEEAGLTPCTLREARARAAAGNWPVSEPGKVPLQ
jgi:hypothetical protein